MAYSKTTILARVGFLLLLLFASCQEDSARQTRPNILIIVTDDQGYADLSCFDHAAADIETPNMDRLAKEGVLFTQAYVTAPVCSPSRAGWNTGRYQQRWGHWKWGKDLPQDVRTLAEYLREAGYATAKIGKSDFGANYHSIDAREFPLNHGYDQFLGFSSHAHDYFLLSEAIEKRTPDPHGHSAALGPLYWNRDRRSFEEGYLTEIFTDQAVEYLQRNEGQPFFMTVAYNSVHHLIHEVPDRYLERFGAEKVPNYNPDQNGTYKDYYDKYAGPEVVGDKYRRWYLANLNCLDDNIGRLLDALDSLGLQENTLVIFFSDNGGSPLTGALNKPLSGSKYNVLEGGIRVPFMMRYPDRFTPGQIYPHIVSSLDIVPTCLEIAGVGLPADVGLDGLSLLQDLSQQTPQGLTRGALFWHFRDEFAAREGDWKIVQTKERPGGLRLYNLAEDLAETEDLAEEHPEVLARLMNQYQTWKQAMESVGP